MYSKLTEYNSTPSITGLIISAGFSKRMNKFKPLLEYQGKSFLLNVVDKILDVCDKVLVVTGHNASLIENELTLKTDMNKIQTVHNPDYVTGMFSSLKAGIEKTTDSDWILYHFVDQPSLDMEFYRDFINQVEKSYDWIQPTNDNKNGHPILFNSKIAKLIKKTPTSGNLKDLTQNPKIKKKYWTCNYPEIHTDIDTLQKYQNLINN